MGLVQGLLSGLTKPVSTGAAAAVFVMTVVAIRSLVLMALGDPLTIQQRVEEIARRRRLSDYPEAQVDDAGDDPGDETGPVRRRWAFSRLGRGERVTKLLNGLLEKSSQDKRLSLALERADVTLKPGEFVACTCVAAAAGAGIGLAVGGGTGAVLVGVAGAAAPFLWIRQRQAKRVKQFETQLADALTMIGNSLRSGYSLIQAMDIVAKEMPKPVSSEFGRIVQEAGFNIPLEESLAGLGRRVESDDLDLMITAILIQRQVGGNLAEVLDRISTTIRERARILGEVRTLTAQGRISGIVIALLPVALCLILSVMNREYMLPFFRHPLGRAMLGVACVMQVTGMLIVRKIVDIKV